MSSVCGVCNIEVDESGVQRHACTLCYFHTLRSEDDHMRHVAERHANGGAVHLSGEGHFVELSRASRARTSFELDENAGGVCALKMVSSHFFTRRDGRETCQIFVGTDVIRLSP